MLVLSRKKGQAVSIAAGITVTVREISGTRVLLGFEAPSDVRIVRQELPLRDLKRRSKSTRGEMPTDSSA